MLRRTTKQLFTVNHNAYSTLNAGIGGLNFEGKNVALLIIYNGLRETNLLLCGEQSRQVMSKIVAHAISTQNIYNYFLQ